MDGGEGIRGCLRRQQSLRGKKKEGREGEQVLAGAEPESRPTRKSRKSVLGRQPVGEPVCQCGSERLSSCLSSCLRLSSCLACLACLACLQHRRPQKAGWQGWGQTLLGDRCFYWHCRWVRRASWATCSQSTARRLASDLPCRSTARWPSSAMPAVHACLPRLPSKRGAHPSPNGHPFLAGQLRPRATQQASCPPFLLNLDSSEKLDMEDLSGHLWSASGARSAFPPMNL